MKKYFGSLRAVRYFLPLFLGVFMISPVWAYTRTPSGIYINNPVSVTYEQADSVHCQQTSLPTDTISFYFYDTNNQIQYQASGDVIGVFPQTFIIALPITDYKAISLACSTSEYGEYVEFNNNPFAFTLNPPPPTPIPPPPSFLNGVDGNAWDNTEPFGESVASISTALFDDMGQGGILELIIGISLGLLLLDWLIGHFKSKRKNEFATTYKN